MNSLRIKLYQNLCNYRKEGSFGYVQTYPLPTPSMIRGMVHEILGVNEYLPMKISIQGESSGVVTNVQRVYKFDRDRKSRPNNPYVVTVKNNEKTVTHGILFVDLHINIKLILHIVFKTEDDLLLKKLYEKMQESVPVLGRNEDIALIEELKIVELGNFSGRSAITKLPMYVFPDVLTENVGTKYRLPFWYDKVESFEENRNFHFVDVNYIGKRVALINGNIMEDEDKNIVVFLDAGE